MRIKFGARVQRTDDHADQRNATLHRRRTARGCRLCRLRFQNVRHPVTHGILTNLTKTPLNRHFSEIHLLPETPTRANKSQIQENRGGTMEEFVCRSVRLNIDRISGGSSTFSKKGLRSCAHPGWTGTDAGFVKSRIEGHGWAVWV